MTKKQGAITEKQLETLSALRAKENLTQAQVLALLELEKKEKESEGLSATAEEYLRQWLLEEKWQRVKEIDSKYLTKGIEKEEAAISLLQEYFLKNGKEILLRKNEERLENSFLTGTPDLILSDMVIDTKCSWGVFTFPFWDKEVKNKDYFFQLQGYMALTGLHSAKLAYCLVNTPEMLVQDEIYRASFKFDTSGELEEQIKRNHNFDMFPVIPIEERIRVFDIPRDDNVIAAIYEKVETCRDFLSRL